MAVTSIVWLGVVIGAIAAAVIGLAAYGAVRCQD